MRHRNNEHGKGAVEKARARSRTPSVALTGDRKPENEGKLDQVKGAELPPPRRGGILLN
jgi:hypothetical protein